MTRDYDAEISNKNAELEALKVEMDKIRQEFVKSTAIKIAQWYNYTAARRVRENPQNTLNTPKERLASMKDRIKQLVDSADQITAEALSKPSLWWHLTPQENDLSGAYRNYGDWYSKNTVESAIRIALGKLGLVLEEYGYNITTKGYCYTNKLETWNNSATDQANPVPYYPGNFEWSQEMKTIMQKYDSTYSKGLGICRQISDIDKAKQVKKAADAWKDA